MYIPLHLILLALFWIAWCAAHSLLISKAAHRYAERILKNRSGCYRLLYVIFSLITLLPVLWYQFSLPQRILLEHNPVISLIQSALLVYSLLMFYLGGKNRE